jgi:hypothetical protein
MSAKRWMLVAILLVVTACSRAEVGPLYQPTPAPPGAGIVYIYRPAQLKGSGFSGAVVIDGMLVGAMANGGYVPFRIGPGRHILTVTTKNQVVDTAVELQPAGELFVRYDLSFSGTRLTVVPPHEARAEIRDCGLLPGGYDGRDQL